jgi:hypothetical protein
MLHESALSESGITVRPRDERRIAMLLTFNDRQSPSSYIERVWRCHSTQGGSFHSMAEGNLELVITRLEGFSLVTLRGPVTRAETIACPPNGRWLAIRFRLGVFFRDLPTAALLDHNDLNFPVWPDGKFRFAGRAWELPTYENAEIFVERLAKCGVIGVEPVVQAAIHGERQALGQRSVQRRFLRAVGMTHATFQKIERARHAVELLRGGASVLDVIHDAGYFDQAHLGRSLKRLIGLTPKAVYNPQAQLSFSYKTEPRDAG